MIIKLLLLLVIGTIASVKFEISGFLMISVSLILVLSYSIVSDIRKCAVFSRRKIFLILMLIVLSYPVFISYRLDKSVNSSIICERDTRTQIIGRVTMIERSYDSTSLILSKITVINPDGVKNSKSGRLKVIYKTELMSEISTVKLGDIIEGNFKITTTKPPMNLFDEDFRLIGLIDGIHAISWADEFCKARQLSSTLNPILIMANKLIDSINKMEAYMSKEGFGVLKAMLVGDKSAIHPDLEEVFKKIGISHIFSISGLHTLVVFSLISLLLGFFRIKGTKRLMIIAVTLYTYALVSGMSQSVIRALIFMILLVSGETKKKSSLSLLIATVFIHLVINPLAIFDKGLHLSYVAFSAIIYIVPMTNSYLERRYKISERMRNAFKLNILKMLSTSFLIQLLLLPTLSSFIEEYFILSPLINVIFVPLASIIIMIGIIVSILIGLFVPLGFVLKGIDVLIRLSIVILKYIFNIKFLFIGIPYFAPLIAVALTCLVFSIFYFIRHRSHVFNIRRAFTRFIKWKHSKYIFAFIGLVLTTKVIVNISTLYIYFINVGNGDSCLVKSHINGTVLIDAGGGEKESDWLSKITSEFLRKMNIRTIDVAIMTHAHSDHSMGFINILKFVKIESFVVSKYEPINDFSRQLLQALSLKKIQVFKMAYMDKFSLGKLFFTVLSPKTDKKLSENDISLVISLAYEGFNALFEADVESLIESELSRLNLDRYDLLKVAHHGSKTSSGSIFISKIMPSFSVISVGKNNYNHPDPKVVERLYEVNSRVFRTDEDGTIIFKYCFGKIYIKKHIDIMKNPPLFRVLD